jgi:S-adenosylmethionine:tRNA ribosyltransferase-isomerase
MKLNEFDYTLPKELIAQYPVHSRELSRMLVLDRDTGNISHKRFTDFPSYIEEGDILALNDTKVINARLAGKKTTGGKAEIFLLEKLGKSRFKALIRPSARIREGSEIIFNSPVLKARVLSKKAGGNTVEFLPGPADTAEELEKAGEIPLPPYIKRNAGPSDKERYQTVYAARKGATAAPTAGLHFTKEILRHIESKGARLAYLTLHVSYGTFAPVKSEDVTCHRMHSEQFELREVPAKIVNNAREKGSRIFAVGTTSCRVLETCAVSEKMVEARRGKTDLFIYPPYEFKIVDALLTNFHLPKSTLLMLVSAFAGKELIFKAYREAIAEKYRFFSYGDCMLII